MIADSAKSDISCDELTSLMAGGAELGALSHELERGDDRYASVARQLEAEAEQLGKTLTIRQMFDIAQSDRKYRGGHTKIVVPGSPERGPTPNGRVRHLSMVVRIAFAAIYTALLAACSSPPIAAPPAPAIPNPSTNITSSATAAPVLSPSEPTELRIPRIGARSSLIPLGLNPDQTVEVPPVHQPMQAGWYRYARTPGEPGPAVILGHVDGNGQPGIFYRLRELVPGDEIEVSRTDGSTARFVVRQVEQITKDRFPVEAVYGETDNPELRLITCGGSFDQAARSYRDNIIVYAILS